MTKYLARLLGADEALFARRIELLERASLQTGVDIRLTTLIRKQVKDKIRDLDLDPEDTTAEELYHALRTKALQSELALRKVLKISDDAVSSTVLIKTAKYYSKPASKQAVWSVKKVSLKKILSAAPPQRTMKVLKYRSMASMLKRETALELYILASLIEGESYKRKVMQLMKKLQPSDFEDRPLEIICIDEKRWKLVTHALRVKTVPVYSVPEVSAIVVLPVDTKRTATLTLLTSSLLLKEMQHCKEHAAYLKLKMLDPNLHSHVEIIALQGKIPLFTLHNEQIYWHHMHHVYSKQESLPDHFGPHMSQKDLEWVRIESQLSALTPELAFWIDTHNLAFVSETDVVSMHLVDVCMSVLYEQSLETSLSVFVKDVVADELLEMYLELPPFSRMLQEHSYKLTDTVTEMLYA